MDFVLSKEQQMLRKMYREFAENEVKPLAAEIDEELNRYRSQRLPAIILIPGVSGNTGRGIAEVKRSVEQAVGSDIIFGNDN